MAIAFRYGVVTVVVATRKGLQVRDELGPVQDTCSCCCFVSGDQAPVRRPVLDCVCHGIDPSSAVSDAMLWAATGITRRTASFRFQSAPPPPALATCL